jgi:hypothetical protein
MTFYSFSWQVRSNDCFAKVVDQSLLTEGVTGIPQSVALIFIGRLLKEEETFYLNLVSGNINVTCKIRRFRNRHRLYMANFKDYLKSKHINIGDLLIFDRSLVTDDKFYITAISQSDVLLISPLETTEDLVGTSVRISSTRRVGQGAFRELLVRRHMGRCCLSGIVDVANINHSILRASHIKSWVDSDQHEKVDVDNGLLLAPHYDILFDKGLISFDRKGTVLRSAYVGEELTSAWQLDKLTLPHLTDEVELYMRFHRESHGF